MWIVYFALAVALLALAILAFLLARRRSPARPDSYSSGDYVTIASVFVNVATLLVALVALYVAFQSLTQTRGPATEPARPGGPAAAIQPQPPAQASAKSAAAPDSGLPAVASAQAGKPDVRVEFEMSATALGAILVNESATQAATEISCEARLWDLDDPDDDSFEDPIATPCGASYLNPRTVLGPARLVEGPAERPRVIENSDRFFGYLIVGCPLCLATRAYAVYFVLGSKQGWTARAEPGNPSAATFTRDAAEAAAAQFLTRTDKQPIRTVPRL